MYILYVCAHSATGWLIMKAVLCAVRLDPCGGWNPSESGDYLLKGVM